MATHDEVLRLTDALLAERPGDDAAHELRARALLALGRVDEAEQHAADAVRLDPDEIRYRELLAQVLAARGDHRDAAAEYGRLARNDPRQRDWLLAEAGERLDAAQVGRAAEAARAAVRLDPLRRKAQLDAGHLARPAGRRGERLGRRSIGRAAAARRSARRARRWPMPTGCSGRTRPRSQAWRSWPAGWRAVTASVSRPRRVPSTGSTPGSVDGYWPACLRSSAPPCAGAGCTWHDRPPRTFDGR